MIMVWSNRDDHDVAEKNQDRKTEQQRRTTDMYTADGQKLVKKSDAVLTSKSERNLNTDVSLTKEYKNLIVHKPGLNSYD